MPAAGATDATGPREFWPWLGHNAWRLQFAVFVGWVVSLFVPPVLSLSILAVTIPAYTC